MLLNVCCRLHLVEPMHYRLSQMLLCDWDTFILLLQLKQYETYT